MRVRLLRSLVYAGHERMTGDFIDVSDGLGQTLLAAGAAKAAEQAKALPSPPNIKALLKAPATKKGSRSNG